MIDHIVTELTDKDDLVDFFCDKLWDMDSVTGNASGTYTFNSFDAESYLCHNFDLLDAAVNEIGMPKVGLDPEVCDVTIRCFLLRMQLEKVIDDLIKAGRFPQLQEED